MGIDIYKRVVNEHYATNRSGDLVIWKWRLLGGFGEFYTSWLGRNLLKYENIIRHRGKSMEIFRQPA